MRGKILQGNVVLSGMLKTLKVKVGFSKKHPRYNKRYVFHNTFKVHCEDVSKYKEGDLVEIVESTPISKSKSWRVFERLEKSDTEEIKKSEKVVKPKKKKEVKIVKEKK